MATQTEQIDGTTIRVTIETRDRLAKLGAKNDSYDDIVKRLLDQNEVSKNSQ